MEITASYDNNNPLRRGLSAGLPIAFGYMPVAITFGLLAGATGLSVYEAVLMSMIVFAGAAQYMALSMIAVSAGMIEIVLATFIVNFRHLLLSASVQERAEPSSKRYRALFGFFLTDEVFAVTSVKQPPLQTAYILGTGITAYSSWVFFTGAGYYTGAFLPPVLQESMGIALYALFIALLVPSVKEVGRPALILALLGGGFHWIYQLQLATGWSIMAATITAVIVYELVEQRIGGKQ